MTNDKAFALYALALITAVGSLFCVAVATGIASIPPMAFIIEHVALAVFIRSAYKSFDGTNPVVDFLEFYGWKTPAIQAPADALPAGA